MKCLITVKYFRSDLELPPVVFAVCIDGIQNADIQNDPFYKLKL